ncbi:hypothetical protein [Demequina gelatinilytica]|uniref:hypothetical protein n=1 Tax=Demequina gelatinilytica TaxID=1638980 RepID=UPI0007836710|nr:hypothetical protein [Demequina gelatinilytica]
METTDLTKRDTAATLRVVGGMFLAITGVGGLLGVLLGILFYAIGRPELWPVPLMVVMTVLLVACLPLGVRLIVTGVDALVASAEESQIDGLAEITGPLPALDRPAPVDDVAAALSRIDGLDLPYAVAIARDGADATLTVTWRTEEMRWRTVLTRGSAVMRWRMVVRLDGATGRYRFTEHSSSSRIVGNAATGTLSGAARWHRGKSFGAGRIARVWAIGQVTAPDGDGSSGTIRLAPRDAKIPVFAILRAYGWRPRSDRRLLRMWEY